MGAFSLIVVINLLNSLIMSQYSTSPGNDESQEYILHDATWEFCNTLNTDAQSRSTYTITSSTCQQFIKTLFINSLIEAGFKNTTIGASFDAVCNSVVSFTDDVFSKVCNDAKLISENDDIKQLPERNCLISSLRMNGLKMS